MSSRQKKLPGETFSVSTNFPAEVSAIGRGIEDLCLHLEKQLRTIKSRERNLVSGFLGRRVEELAAESSCNLKVMLLAFVDAAGIEVKRFARFEIIAEHTVFRALLAREMERLGCKSFQDAKKTALHRGYRRDWVLKLTPAEAEVELRALCDWIEAHLARAAFVASRASVKTMSTSDLEADVHTLIMWLHYSSLLSDKEKSQRRRDELDVLSLRFNIDDPDASKPVSEAHLHALERAPKAPASMLERALFDLWPLVLHGHWSKTELYNVIRVSGVSFDDDELTRFAGDLDTSCRNLGLRGGSASGQTGRGRTRKEAPGVTLGKAILRGDLPGFAKLTHVRGK